MDRPEYLRQPQELIVIGPLIEGRLRQARRPGFLRRPRELIQTGSRDLGCDGYDRARHSGLRRAKKTATWRTGVPARCTEESAWRAEESGAGRA